VHHEKPRASPNKYDSMNVLWTRNRRHTCSDDNRPASSGWTWNNIMAAILNTWCHAYLLEDHYCQITSHQIWNDGTLGLFENGGAIKNNNNNNNSTKISSNKGYIKVY